MSPPPGPEPGQSLESWVRETLLGPAGGGAGEPGPDLPAAPDPAVAPGPAPVSDPAAVPEPLPPAVPVVRAASSEPSHRPGPPMAAPAPTSSQRAHDVVPARRHRRLALGTAVAVIGSIGFGIVVAGTLVPPPAVVQLDPLGSGATAVPERQIADDPVPAASELPTAPPPVAVEARPVAFGSGRTDVGDGWRVAVTRPYLCPVLMTLPELAVADTRLIRMTITLVNAADRSRNAREWSLAATADGRPAELVLRPDVGFDGVPERVLAPGERVRFLVAVRLPAGQVTVEVDATRDGAVRATLTGRV